MLLNYSVRLFKGRVANSVMENHTLPIVSFSCWRYSEKLGVN